MCALFGFLNYGKKVSWKTMQKLVQALANASEVRGNHASGIAYNNDERMRIYKRPKPAHKLHFHIPHGTVAVMGHTRLTTQGDQKHNQNNHPFPGQAGTGFALAHNGVLYNDMLLREDRHLPETSIETDSYIAVQLIEEQQELTFESLRYMAEAVRGSFTFTVLDEKNNLYFVKGDSPLYLIHIPSLGLYLYTSTREIMTAALKHLHLRLPQHEVIEITEGDLLRIAPDGTISRDRFTMHEDDLYTHWFGRGYYYGYGFNWKDSFTESRSYRPDDETDAYLIDLCGYYGVAIEDVRHLRNLGYTLDEIEELLLDPDSYGLELALAEL